MRNSREETTKTGVTAIRRRRMGKSMYHRERREMTAESARKEKELKGNYGNANEYRKIE